MCFDYNKKKNRARFPCFELSEMFVIDFLLQASNEWGINNIAKIDRS